MISYSIPRPVPSLEVWIIYARVHSPLQVVTDIQNCLVNVSSCLSQLIGNLSLSQKGKYFSD